MKRLNSDKIYKYVPKKENPDNSEIVENNKIVEKINSERHINHFKDFKKRYNKNRIISHNKSSRIKHYNQNHNINQTNQSYKKCSKCNRNIIDELSSFYNEEKNEYYCFDCALNEAKNLLSPDPKNIIMYLGAGTFGEIKEIKSEKKFMIIKRIKFSKPKFEKFSMNYLPFDQY
ncbi:MAG TPA: hypothetical protein PLF21_06560 [Exilispira sp.]|nr:hypothetical protein [Exilispira sp.]